MDIRQQNAAKYGANWEHTPCWSSYPVTDQRWQLVKFHHKGSTKFALVSEVGGEWIDVYGRKLTPIEFYKFDIIQPDL